MPPHELCSIEQYTNKLREARFDALIQISRGFGWQAGVGERLLRAHRAEFHPFAQPRQLPPAHLTLFADAIDTVGERMKFAIIRQELVRDIWPAGPLGWRS
jgi:hypothetical protein